MSRRLGSGDRHFDAAGAVDALRQLVARVDALAHATEALLERMIWNDDEDDTRRRLEHLAHLMGATAEAARVAVDAGSELASELAKHPGRS
jgi:two-component sensor histidine kinase